MLRPLLDKIATEFSGERCLDHVATITRYHRIQASPGYRAAATECERILIESGVDAQVTAYPATANSWAWANQTPQEWHCQDAELWLLGPNGERVERLAWYGAMNLAIIQRSCATPSEGIFADLACIDAAEEAASWTGQDVAGKIVLVGNGDIHQMLRHAQGAGAVGLMTARMTYHPPVRPEGDLPDSLQYTSFWWAEDEPKGWGFVLSTRQGARLKALASGGSVKLWAKVEASFYDGTIENVEAVIPGTTDEEVLVVSHLCHPKPSSNDNATGPATVMEVARVLQKLIQAGRLPQPRRTIRFLHPPEMTGTYAHLAGLTPAQRSKIVAALNVDMVGQKQDETGSVLLCEYPPMAIPSFAGDLLALILDEVAAETTSYMGTGTRYALFRHAVTGFAGGSDHYILADPSVGVPCPMIIQWPDRFYHTSEDTIDRVDPAMMRKVGLMTAAYAYFLANAGETEAVWLASEMVARFPAQLHDALADASVAAPPDAVAAFRLARKQADLGALRRLASGERLEAALALCKEQLGQAVTMEQARAGLGGRPAVAPDVAVVKHVVEGWLGRGDLIAIRPLRVHPGPISLRPHLPKLAPAERESWRSFSSSHPGAAALADTLCYWADGKRTLAEICRLTALEKGRCSDAWALGYCQLLSRLHLMRGID